MSRILLQDSVSLDEFVAGQHIGFDEPVDITQQFLHDSCDDFRLHLVPVPSGVGAPLFDGVRADVQLALAKAPNTLQSPLDLRRRTPNRASSHGERTCEQNANHMEEDHEPN
jgi:hypothetical protein